MLYGQNEVNDLMNTSVLCLFCVFQRNLSLAGAAALVVAMVSLKPPARLPDIFTVLIAIYSCVHFMFFLGYFYRVQLMYSSEKDDHFASTTSGRTLKIGTGRYHTSKVSGKQL